MCGGLVLVRSYDGSKKPTGESTPPMRMEGALRCRADVRLRSGAQSPLKADRNLGKLIESTGFQGVSPKDRRIGHKSDNSQQRFNTTVASLAKNVFFLSFFGKNPKVVESLDTKVSLVPIRNICVQPNKIPLPSHPFSAETAGLVHSVSRM